MVRQVVLTPNEELSGSEQILLEDVTQDKIVIVHEDNKYRLLSSWPNGNWGWKDLKSSLRWGMSTMLPNHTSFIEVLKKGYEIYCDEEGTQVYCLDSIHDLALFLAHEEDLDEIDLWEFDLPAA